MEQLEGLMAQLPELMLNYGLKLIFAIVIFIVGKYAANLVKRVTVKLLDKRRIDKTVSSFVANLAGATVLVFAVIATLGQIGVQTASLVAVLGAAGLAVGLALQGSLSNFAAGVLMVMFRPCRVGDYIEAAGVAGTVEEITIFATRLRTPDNKVVVTPNSSIMNGTITNFSTMDTRRVDLVIGVAYDADIGLVKKVLAEVLERNDYVLKEPAALVALGELGASSINFMVRPWVKGTDYWTARFQLLEQIKAALDSNGIGIPYPQLDVHVKAMPGQLHSAS